jgi:glucosamine 6-phosphate synthetase-like amidotransferase/phosphosugar isomerase protein
VFESQTDTEVIAHLIHHHLSGADLLAALQTAVKELTGAYALAVVQPREPDRWSARAWAARCWWAWAKARTSSPPTSRR